MTATDDDLVTRLTATFTAHESDVDPDRARVLARTAPTPLPHRRRWIRPAVVAAVVVLVAGSVGFAVGRHRSSDGAAAAISVPAGVEPGTNRRLTEELAARTLADVPIPPGSQSTLVTHPMPHLGACACDPSLYRAQAWVVPLTPAGVRAFFRRHVDALVRDRGDRIMWSSREVPTYATQPSLSVTTRSISPGRTLIRIEVFLAARNDRTGRSLVPTTGVTSIEVTADTIDEIDLPTPDVGARSFIVTSPDDIEDLVTDYNRLLGRPEAGPEVCFQLPSLSRTFLVTFRWPGHTLTATDSEPRVCGGPDVRLTLDGRPLAVRLDGSGPRGSAWYLLVARILAGS